MTRHRKPTYSLKSEAETLLTTQFEDLARTIAPKHFADRKTVSLYDNTTRLVLARWNYGRPQKLRSDHKN